MSQEAPTPGELDSILQLQNGDYGVEVPEWWPVPTEQKPALDRALYSRYKLVQSGWADHLIDGMD